MWTDDMERPFCRQGHAKRPEYDARVTSEGTLVGIAQPAVAIAGFAGVAAVLRQGPEWTDLQSFRLRVLVRNSLGVMFMALLPSLYFAALHDEARAIGAASGTAAAWMIVTIVQLQGRLIRTRTLRTPANYVT